MMPFRQGQRRYWPNPPRRRRIDDDRYARRLPVKSKISPARFSWLDGRSKPGPTDMDFAVLQSITASPANPCLQISMGEAYILAEKALKDHNRASIDRFHTGTRMTAIAMENLPFQVFDELDAEFFRSVLKGNVSLGWKELAHGMLSRTCRASRKSNPRIRILLSPRLVRSGSPFDVFAALIHQMIHAYYLQCCGFRDRGHTGEGHDLGHDQAFQALLECIREHCTVLKKDLSKALSTPGSSKKAVSQKPIPGTSCCYGQKKRLNQVDVQNWRDAAAAKTKSPKDDGDFPKDMYYVHKNGTEDPPLELEKWLYPREAYIFLHFDNRHYPVARSLISDLTALTSSTYFEDKVFLQLPQGTSEGDFLAFYFFLVHAMYPPYFKALNAESTSFEPTRRGPPKIQPYDASAPTYLNRLVSAFQLGTVLQYRPFRDFTLKGLYSLESTAEDPVTVLEQVYCRRNSLQHLATPASIEAPDAQLRVWTRRWLAVENDAPGSGQHVARSGCNLGVVRSHPRYEPLRASCVELAEDDDATVRGVAYKHRNNNVVRLESPMLSPAPSLLTSQPGQVPLLRPLNLPSRIICPTTLPPRHFPNSSCFPPGESRTSIDMSSMLPNLPSDYFQYPHNGLGVPAESLTDAEAYHKWMLQRKLKDDEVRAWLSEERNNSYDVIYQQGLPSLEKSRRPY